MFWEGKNLWIADETEKSLYQLNFDGKVFTLSDILALDFLLSGALKLSGISFDGKNLWIVSEGSGMVLRTPFQKLLGGKNK